MSFEQSLWLLHSSDRKCIPFVHRAVFSASSLEASTDSRYGATVFSSAQELLSVRRPLQVGSRLDKLIDTDLRANRMIGFCASAEGNYRPLDTPPFPCRGLSFAMIGDIPPMQQPFTSAEEEAFCLRSWRGKNPVELTGLRLNYRLLRQPSVLDANHFSEVVQAVLSEVLCSIRASSFERYTVLVANHRFGFVLNRGRQVMYTEVRGDYRRKNAQRESGPFYDHLRAAVVADGLELRRDIPIQSLPEQSILIMSDANIHSVHSSVRMD